uniref:Si:ch211-215k15.4 n=1 Tax=Nothobranchius furzeri TaxID=105023 RepID=A0A8C6MLM2_NOTFU
SKIKTPYIIYNSMLVKDENVALRGTATQSTRLLGNTNVLGIAINAIDGNRNSQMMAGSCTHTAQQADPWWRVDLLESYIIDHINIVNRGDCCAERINGAQIHIGDSADWSANPQAGTIDQLAAGDTYSRYYQRDVKGRYVTILIAGADKILSLCEVEGMEGLYVNVVIPGRIEFLTLCEVEVYGSKLD